MSDVSVVETFESAADGTSISAAGLENAWSGNATIVNHENPNAAVNDKNPYNAILPKNVGNEKCLEVDGVVSCVNEKVSAPGVKPSMTGSSQIDFLISDSDYLLDEPLPTEGLGDAQIALAFGEGCYDNENPTRLIGRWLCLYTKIGSQPGWQKVAQVSNAEIAEKFSRVTLIMDYPNNKCMLLLNGRPVSSEFGYATATAASVSSGCWYALATAQPSSSRVNSLVFNGMGKVDDVIISHAELSGENSYSPVTEDLRSVSFVVEGDRTMNVPMGDFVKLGIDPTTISSEDFRNLKATDGTGYSVVAKLETGYNLDDGKTLTPSDMSIGVEGGRQVLSLTIPAPSRGVKPTYSVRLLDGTFDASGNVKDTPVGSPIVSSSSENGHLKFELPGGVSLPKVLKIKLSAESAWTVSSK